MEHFLGKKKKLLLKKCLPVYTPLQCSSTFFFFFFPEREESVLDRILSGINGEKNGVVKMSSQ